MKNTEIKLNKQITKLKNQLTTNVSNGLSASMNTVFTAMDFHRDINTPDPNIICEKNYVARVHPITGEICDYLIHFDHMSLIHSTIEVLEAYLMTNQDVLTASDVYKLNRIIEQWKEIW